jgi:hypothetical protein
MLSGSEIITGVAVLQTVPLRHAGAKGDRMYSSYSFLASAIDGGEWSTSRPGRSSPMGKGLPVLIRLEAGWASEMVWTMRLDEKSFTSAGDETPVVHSDMILTSYTLNTYKFD